MSKFDKIIPKGSVPNCQLQIANRYDNRWFKCKLKPPKNRARTCDALSTQVSVKQLRRANGCGFLRYVSGQGGGNLRGIEGFHDDCNILFLCLL